MKVMFFGKQRAGKDTAADYLVRRYGFTKISLATPLYEILEKYYGVYEKDRQKLIDLGKGTRLVDPDVWAKYALREASFYDHVVIPDVRFPNEYMLLLRSGFIPVKIEADVVIRSSREGYTPEHENDPSEKYVDMFEWDWIIDNNGTLVELYEQIDLLIHWRGDICM